MKALYFSNYNLNDENSGVSKKIKMQLKSFVNLGTDMVYPTVFSETFFSKLYIKLPFLSSIYDINVNKYLNDNSLDGIDFIYFRHNCFTKLLLKNFSIIKKKNNKIKIIYEIPTYPYDNNENHLKNFFTRLKDKKYRKYAKEYIDYIVDYSGYDNIFNIKTIEISNGIDAGMIPLKKSEIDIHPNHINLIGVALLDKTHGYDRVIASLSEYNKTNHNITINFHIVGNGDEYNNLNKLIQKYNLNKYVFMHGFKSGKDLDTIYNISDIGVGPLGLHRRQEKLLTSCLKTKEFSARGLPFITAASDLQFNDSCDFIYSIESNDKIFDLDLIVKWYYDLINKHKDFNKYIREYAEKNLTWEKQLIKILEVIKS